MKAHRIIRPPARWKQPAVIVLAAAVTAFAFGPVSAQAQQAPVSVDCPTETTKRVGRQFGGDPPVTFAVGPNCYCMQGTPPSVAELTERARFEAALAALTENGLAGLPLSFDGATFSIQSFGADQTVTLDAWVTSGPRAVLLRPLITNVSLPATLAVGQIVATTFQCYRQAQMETMHQTYKGYADAVVALHSFLVSNP